MKHSKEKQAGLLHGERSFVKPSGLRHFASSLEGEFSIGATRAPSDSIQGSMTIKTAGSDRKPRSLLTKFDYKGEK